MSPWAVGAAMLAAMSLGVTPLRAQDDSVRVQVQTALVVGTPLAGFGDRVDDAIGVELGVRLSQAGRRGWRVGGSAMLYGHEERDACVTTNFQCRVRIGVATTNSLWTVETGPDVDLLTGPLTLRGHLVAGASLIVTNTGLTSDYDPVPILNTQELADGGFVWGGGIAASYTPAAWAVAGFAFEVEAQYRQHGMRRYLVEGGVVETTTGVVLDVQRSYVSLLNWRLGVSFRPKGRARDRD